VLPILKPFVPLRQSYHLSPALTACLEDWKSLRPLSVSSPVVEL